MKFFFAAIFFILLTACQSQPQSQTGPSSSSKLNPLQQLVESKYGKTAIINFYAEDTDPPDMRKSLMQLMGDEIDKSKVCTDVNSRECVSKKIDVTGLSSAINFLFSEKFGSIFKYQAANRNKPDKRNSKFGPASDWVFINTTKVKLADSYTISGEKFKQVDERYLRDNGIAHFLDITDIERYGNTYIFNWVRGMKGTFGRSAVELLNNGTLRFQDLSNFHSSSGTRKYMKTIFSGVKCIDETQLIYYASTYGTGKCPAVLHSALQ